MKKVRKQNYPNLDDFDMTGYEELTGHIILINQWIKLLLSGLKFRKLKVYI